MVEIVRQLYVYDESIIDSKRMEEHALLEAITGNKVRVHYHPHLGKCNDRCHNVEPTNE